MQCLQYYLHEYKKTIKEINEKNRINNNIIVMKYNSIWKNA